MKKFLSLVLCIIICMGLSACSQEELPEIADNEPASSVIDTSRNKSSSSSANSSDKSSSDAVFNPYNEEAYYLIDFSSWQMRLVNPWNSIPEDFDPSLSEIDQKYRPDPQKSSQLYFDSRATDMLVAMIESAKNDGIKLTVLSAYRTNDFQISNFNNKVYRVMKANPALTRAEAEDEAAKVVARPGTSEHQLGLAVDFNSVEDSFRNTTAYKWLVENCTDFGFILRYTAEFESKTGIIPEPWHYRFVGVENAKMIEASGLCLEEFIKKYSKR